MKSQIEKRMNINLTEKEVENLDWLLEYYRCAGFNRSDCVREAINQLTYILKREETLKQKEEHYE